MPRDELHPVGYFDLVGEPVRMSDWQTIESFNPGRDRQVTTFPDGDGYATVVVQAGRFVQLTRSPDRRAAADTHNRAYPFERHDLRLQQMREQGTLID